MLISSMNTGAGTSAAKNPEEGGDVVIGIYNVGDPVKTVNGLVADVVAVNVQSGTYDIKYRKDNDVDRNVLPKNFQKYVPPPRRKRESVAIWEYRDEPVETMQQYIDRTGVSEKFNVLPPDVKRRRGQS